MGDGLGIGWMWVRLVLWEVCKDESARPFAGRRTSSTNAETSQTLPRLIPGPTKISLELALYPYIHTNNGFLYRISCVYGTSDEQEL